MPQSDCIVVLYVAWLHVSTEQMAPRDSLNDFRNDHVKMLYNHFSGLFEDRVDSLDELMRDWGELKQFVTANMNHLSGTAVMETLYSSYRSVYPRIIDVLFVLRLFQPPMLSLSVASALCCK